MHVYFMLSVTSVVLYYVVRTYTLYIRTLIKREDTVIITNGSIMMTNY